jgi:hypothetical protein
MRSGGPDQSKGRTAKPPRRRSAPKAVHVSGSAGAKTEPAQLALELQEARERQAATAEVLSLISDAPTDLLPVFDRIVKNAARLCQSVLSAVYRREGNMSTWSRTISSLQNRSRRYGKPILPRSQART